MNEGMDRNLEINEQEQMTAEDVQNTAQELRDDVAEALSLEVVVVAAALPLEAVPDVAWELQETAANTIPAISAMMITTMAAILPPLRLGAVLKLRMLFDWAACIAPSVDERYPDPSAASKLGQSSPRSMGLPSIDTCMAPHRMQKIAPSFSS